MRKSRTVSVLLLVAALGGAEARAAELTPQQIYEHASPAVVMVIGYSDGGGRGTGGTGSIVRQDGLVLTNAHVVVEEKTGKPFPRIFVYLKPDRVTGNAKTDLARSVRATVLSFSQPLDLALLKLEGAPGPLPVLELGDSATVRIGDRVAAIGHPEQGGLWTLTTGVVSAEFEDFNNTKGKHVFQTETGLNRGNSGGPLLDTQGHLIGVNTAIARLAPDGMPITSISFSLKSSVAKAWLRQQGVMAQYAARPAEPPATATKPTPTAPKAAPQSAGGPAGSASPPQTAAGPQVHTPARPYNLDDLIGEQSRAETEMEDMMKEMRRDMRNKAGRP